MPDDLLEQFLRRDRPALSRLLSRAARGEPMADVLRALGPPTKRGRVLAITGGAGVGKSTLIGKLLDVIRRGGASVAVLACDPQSPLTGGALLGDRFRMPSYPDDDGVYIRSLATASGHGVLAEHLDVMVRLLETFGFNVILIETVGAGQGDTAVHDLADAVILLLQPETGDDIQWEKAGLLEVADVIVIQKADLPEAAALETQVRQTLGLSGQTPPPVLSVSARTGVGVEALWQAMRELPLRRPTSVLQTQDLVRRAQEMLADAVARADKAADPSLRQIIEDWRMGKLDPDAAALALMRFLDRSD